MGTSSWLVYLVVMLSLPYISVAKMLKISFTTVIPLKYSRKSMNIVWNQLREKKNGQFLEIQDHKLLDMSECLGGQRKITEGEKMEKRLKGRNLVNMVAR